MTNTAHENSYGIIPLHKKNGVWHVLIVQHGAGHWSFPKGHPEPGENPQQVAARELQEETGLTVKRFLSETPLREQYQFMVKGERVYKTVTYFLAEVEGEVIVQAAELRDAEWVPLNECAAHVTFPATKNLCKQTMELLQ